MITVEDIVKSTGGEVISENSVEFSGVSIDSRTIREDEIFFAIKGEHFDGHTFVEHALGKGKGAVVEKRPSVMPLGKVIICVRDTLRSLQELAHYLRMKNDIPVIAVTGSNGKTTTKEMIYAIASQRYRVLKNEGNLNNHIGLPLSLAGVDESHEMIVLEMGMNAAGEIRRLCEIAVPTHGVITNVGTAHIGRLGSYEAVRSAKLEILDGIGVAVINADDRGLRDGLCDTGFKGQVLTYGIETGANVMAADIRETGKGSEFILVLDGKELGKVRLKLAGMFNVYNALAASTVCLSTGLGIEDIRAALDEYRGVAMRFEVIRLGDITIINDTYNANPSSLSEALKELVRMGSGGRLVAVLGDMQELEQFTEEEHRRLGREIVKLGMDVFAGVGRFMKYAADEVSRVARGSSGPEVYTFDNSEEAANQYHSFIRNGDIVLLKGSRIMAMEKILEKMADAL